jgi:hypothetical protein
LFQLAEKENAMRRRFLSVGLLLLVPGISLAQNVPERLLPGGSQIYLRWDVVDKHRAAYDKTAVAQMLKGDTGNFLSALWTYANELLDVALRQADPNIAGMVMEIPKIVSSIHHNGFAMGIEVKSVNPPHVEAVFVFPKAGGKNGSIVPLIDKVAALARADVKKQNVGRRQIREIGNEIVHFGWWQEPDSDVVLTLGTRSPAKIAESAEENTNSFARGQMFAKLESFKEFPTWARGFVDIQGLLTKIGDFSPKAAQIIDQVGLKSLSNVTFYSGLAGKAERSVVEIHTPQSRKGLVGLISQKTFRISDLPPLPSDVTSFTASNFNVRNIYDGGMIIADAAANVFANGAFDPKETVKQVEALLGIKFGDDLFGSFSDLMVAYRSPSEGTLGLGGVYVFKLKDEKKLGAALEGLFKAIPPLPFFEISYAKKAYRGGELIQVKLKSPQGEFSVANMAIHKGWFVLANYPQGVYGFILRSNGELPTWRADAGLMKELDAFPKEFTSIAIADPRPTVQALLAFAPVALSLANSILPNVLPGAPSFDLSTIPHAQDATRQLFPNITISTDDGKRIRVDTRASLALPF